MWHFSRLFLGEGNTNYDGVYVSGVVVFNSANGSGTDDINKEYIKTSGFTDSTTNGNYTTDEMVDKYQTYNLIVSKKIEGNLAQTNHKFPFTVTLENTNTTLAGYIVNPIANTDAELISNNTMVAGTYTANLANNGSLKIVGIPTGTTVQVEEKNDTVDSYVPTITTQIGVTGLTLTKTDSMAQNDTTKLTTTPFISDTTQNTEIGYTNTLDTISPTGLVFKIAPYVLMLAAGVSLIVLFIKRKENDATDMI